MSNARVLTLGDLKEYLAETPVFIETKQNLRPAFFMGVVDRMPWLNGSYRYTVKLMTPAKLAKAWEWRLYNKTWRIWSSKPTREQQVEVRWD